MEQKVEIDGIRINYDAGGNKDGRPVILLHGWGCTLKTVETIRKSIPENYYVISIDLPGHGESEEPKEIWGTFDFVNFLDKFIKRLNITNPILIGHSFGGRVSIGYGSQHPVDKIILVDSAGITPSRSLSYYFKIYSYKFIKKIIKLLNSEEKAKIKIEKLQAKRGSADYKSSSVTMRGIMSKCINEDLKKYMPDIKAPTLLIWGSNDTATPIEDAKIMEKLIPDSGLVEFQDCGHYSFLDNAYGFEKVINEFLK